MAFALAAMGACSPATSSSEVPVTDTGPPRQSFVVSSEKGSAPDTCRAEAAGELMVNFLHDVNTGADPTRWFASTFEWYSMTEGNPRKGGRHFVTYDRADLADYFAKRAEHDESMKILGLSVQYDRDRNIGHLVFELKRTADDTEKFGRIAHGKGAIDCDPGKIMMMSTGMSKGIADDMSLPCPKPEKPERNVAVVCSS